MKIIITEKQYRKLILNEQLSDKDVYSVYIGYLVNLSNSGVNKSGGDIEAVRELRVYYEFLRDGKKPKARLSAGAKVVDKYIKAEIKKITSGEELVSLMDLGSGIKSTK